MGFFEDLGNAAADVGQALGDTIDDAADAVVNVVDDVTDWIQGEPSPNSQSQGGGESVTTVLDAIQAELDKVAAPRRPRSSSPKGAKRYRTLSRLR
jgi:hypothetical protein